MKVLTVSVSALAVAVFSVLGLLGYRTYVEHQAFKGEAVFAGNALEQMYVHGSSGIGYDSEAQNEIQVLFGSAATRGDLEFAVAAQHELEAIREAASQESDMQAPPSAELVAQQKNRQKQILNCVLDLQSWPAVGGELHCPDPTQ